MNCWDQLGLEPTKNPDLIKKAFAAKARLCHPEEDAAGFQSLRAAYRQALQMAKVFEAGLFLEQPLEENAQEPPETPDDLSETFTYVPVMPKAVDPDGGGHMLSAPTADTLNFALADRTQVDVENINQFTIVLRQTETAAASEKPRQAAASPVRLIQLSYIRLFVILVIIFISITGVVSNFGAKGPVSPHRSIVPSDIELTQNQYLQLKNDAAAILNRQDNNRRELLLEVKAGTPYADSAAAAAMLITEYEYKRLVSEYKNAGEALTAESLDKYRRNEESFVMSQILPVLKKGLLEENPSPLYSRLAQLVGIDAYVYQKVWKDYQDSHNQTALDTFLQYHDHLTSGI